MTGRVTIKKQGPLKGELSFPGDKSLSHRAIMFGSLAEGRSHFTNVLSGEDCVCTRRAFEAMGVKIVEKSPTELEIHGAGLRGLKAPSESLYLGNSGTSMRILSGILAGQPFSTTLTGDPSLSSRPMKRVTSYLREMGAAIDGKDGGNYAPLTIRGGNLKPIQVSLAVASAQVKSAILLAGLYADGVTFVTEPLKSRDHTERFLKYFGGEVTEKGTTVSVKGGQRLTGKNFEIAGDISSAAFFMAIAALVPGSDVYFKNVLWNPTRTGIVDVLKRAGVTIESVKTRNEGPETTADFRIRPGTLRAFDVPKKELPALIDEIPILMVLATQAEGTSVIHDAEELRVKETDRIESMSTTLRKMGADIRVEGDTIYIKGPVALKGAKVDSFKDHRTAMSLIVAGMIATGENEVTDLDCINTSFPNFFALLSKIGTQYNKF